MKTLAFILTILSTIAPLLALDDKSYRLPNYVIPEHYDVFITPYFLRSDGFHYGRFNGTAIILIKFLSNDFFDFALNAKDLAITSLRIHATSGEELFVSDRSYDEETEMVHIMLSLRPYVREPYVLNVTFEGNLTNGHHGLYERKYRDIDNRDRSIIVGNLRHGNARSIFPCFDEPWYEATFRLYIDRPNDYASFSNTKPVWVGNLTASRARRVDIYDITPHMPISSLGFVIGVFKPETKRRYRTIVIRVRPALQNKTEFSLNITKTFLDIYGDLFTPYRYVGIEYLQLFGIPYLKKAGQSGSWGLITIDENLLTYNDDEGTMWDKQNTIKTISHEVVFQWLGNAVNFSPEDEYWVGEGLARYYQYFETQKEFPEYAFDKQFMLEVLHKALQYDNGEHSIPLVQKKNYTVSSPLLTNVPHDVIPTKGASIIRMLSHCINTTAYDSILSGLVEYLLRIKGETIAFMPVMNHFFPTMQLPVQFKDFYTEWTEKPGYPVLYAQIFDRGWTVLLSQKRYVGYYHDDNVQLKYTIPITYATNIEPHFTNTTPVKYFSSGANYSHLWFSYSADWLVLNIQQTGFYRVMYCQKLYGGLARALTKGNWSGIHELNRAQYVDDLLSYGFDGVVPFYKVLVWLEYLETETEYTPWMAAINGFRRLMTLLTVKNHKTFGIYVLKMTKTVFKKLGVDRINQSEPYTTTHLRKEIVSLNCRYGRPNCTEKVRRMFEYYLTSDNSSISVDMRSTIICAAMRNVSDENYAKLVNKYTSQTNITEKRRIRYGMGCVKNRTLVQKFYKFVLGSQVPAEEKADALKPLYAENPENVIVVLELVTNGYIALVRACRSWELAAAIIGDIAKYITNAKERNIYRDFVNMEREPFMDPENTLEKALISLNREMIWSGGYQSSIEVYLQPWVSGTAANYIVLYMLILSVLTHILF